MLSIISLPYSSSLIQNYHKLSHLPGFVLLDSSDVHRGRYDILSAYPYERFQISADSENLTEECEKLNQRILSIQQPSHSSLPFQGGAIGYISYDFGERMVGLKSLSHPTLKGMPLVDLGFYDWGIITDHRQQTVSLISTHRHVDTPAILEEIQRLWHAPCMQNSFTMKTSFSPLVTERQYQQAFHAIHQDLREGRAYQVNYTQPFIAEFRGDPWEIYKSIRSVNPVPFSSFVRTQYADILSFSPERFLAKDKDMLITSPIKGSIRRSQDAIEDQTMRDWLAASRKNNAENVMIVDLLRNDLGRIALTGSVHVKGLCEVQSYNSVHHLVSHIEARCLPEISPIEAFVRCFPGGSITGAPKREAMKIIQEHEQFSRGIYCGSIVYFSAHGNFDSNIAIRTITAKDKRLYLAVGGGLVIDSTWEEEFEECYTKIAAIVNQLNSSLCKQSNYD